MPLRLEGVISAVVTPFGPQEELDERTLRGHIEFQLAGGLHGLLFTGGCGEFLNLNDDERRRVMNIAVDQVRGRVPVIIGVLSPDTRHVAELARDARKAGADAVLVLPPYYVTPSTTATYEHYRRVACEAELAVVVYNNPARTNVDLNTAALLKLCEIENIVAVKDCDRNTTSLAEKILEMRDRIEILSGEDDLAFATLMLGAKGGIWATPNLFPDLFVTMYDAVLVGNMTLARECHYSFLRFWKLCFGPNHPATLKAAMAISGRKVGDARSPLLSLNDEQLDAVRSSLEPIRQAARIINRAAQTCD
jgi:4-hydroxy-tetrahydrodipicolinate synthase